MRDFPFLFLFGGEVYS